VPDHGLPAECVINISEGRNLLTVDALRDAGGDHLLDVHSDPEHNRSVLTLGGPLDAVADSARRIVVTAVERIDLRTHRGIHPRLGAADVVPFVPLAHQGPGDPVWVEVLDTRTRLARWAGDQLRLPCFLYGPERSLPEVRRRAFTSLDPDTGPRVAHPTAGASAVGARPVMIAYNVWIGEDPERGAEVERPTPLSVARSLAAELRGPAVRSLGLAVEAGAQVSFNLIDPTAISVADVYDAVATGAESSGCRVLRGELVGLVPAATLAAIPRRRWPELDLTGDRTIEGRMEDLRLPIAPDGAV
jgi:glutamate formiminotransferase / 5-formyltetrahydrofolate cyclo-ligase